MVTLFSWRNSLIICCCWCSCNFHYFIIFNLNHRIFLLLKSYQMQILIIFRNKALITIFRVTYKFNILSSIYESWSNLKNQYHSILDFLFLALCYFNNTVFLINFISILSFFPDFWTYESITSSLTVTENKPYLNLLWWLLVSLPFGRCVNIFDSCQLQNVTMIVLTVLNKLIYSLFC
jgi:hypothetical protein